jgi:rubredoxin
MLNGDVNKSKFEQDVENCLLANSSCICSFCGFEYMENGVTEGIIEGTKFANISDSWVCPDCGCGKDLFVLSS